MNPITETFNTLQNRNEKAFIPFLTVGDPDPETFLELIRVTAPHADIVELGIPFSDPMADGPVIQKANQRALKAGITRTSAFPLIKQVKEISQKPIVLLTYANILGLEPERNNILKKFAEVGVNGIIAADIPVEEAQPLLKDAAEYGIAVIFLATPTTNEARLKQILHVASGFMYLVSVRGVTGAREEIAQETKDTITHIMQINAQNKHIPVCVGFGISSPTQVKEIVQLGADGAIVGSAIIKLIETNLHDTKKMVKEIGFFVKTLKIATKP